jgi:hypothetical protein
MGALHDAFQWAYRGSSLLSPGGSKSILLFDRWQDAQRYGDKVERCTRDVRTNLALTGEPIQDYDWQRLESPTFRIGA